MNDGTYQLYTFLALKERAEQQAEMKTTVPERHVNQGNESMAFYKTIAAMNGRRIQRDLAQPTPSEPVPIPPPSTQISDEDWQDFGEAGFNHVTDNTISPPSRSIAPPPTPVSAVTPPQINRYAPPPGAVNTADNFAEYIANHPKKSEERQRKGKRTGMLIDF